MTGRWSGAALEIDEMDERPLPTLSTPFWMWRAPPDFPRQIVVDGLAPAAIERAWTPLSEDGVVLSRRSTSTESHML
ncbi:hypothetical protein SAMN05216410_0094 [Sanguibacter gelidistatuariae]|uniref:Uncharacterized protein n=1 Tax=Sanguibacter gelidistatuariae TaxID=1814289 RepID=A0A1G6X8H5_9MICO|nr:hypothetical protein [Sanguibacter gelidistatuariae]SDD73606.1 hypothetical protein SAMN05216410_0094 [Sanguibacter gelidistatuariae]